MCLRCVPSSTSETWISDWVRLAALVHEWWGEIARIGWPWLADGSVGDDARMESRVHPKFKTKYRINFGHPERWLGPNLGY